MKETILVTGVSSGIGLDLAHALLKLGYQVIGTLRNSAQIEDIESQFKGLDILFFALDHSNQELLTQQLTLINEQLPNKIKHLILNAGYVEPGPIDSMCIVDLKHQMQVNFLAPTFIAQSLLETVTNLSGRILFINSTSAHIGYPFMGAYCASKHALKGLVDSWRRETQFIKTPLIQISPGPIRTPIWKKAKAKEYSKSKYVQVQKATENFIPLSQRSGASGLSTIKVIETVQQALTAPRPKSNYWVLKRNPLGFHLHRYLPSSILDYFFYNKLN